MIYVDGAWTSDTAGVENFSNSGEAGFYLIKDFEYGTATISEGSIIKSVTIDKTQTKVTYRCQLIDALYGASSGSKIVITYLDKEDYATKTVSFVV
jgi:hypothetical protein